MRLFEQKMQSNRTNNRIKKEIKKVYIFALRKQRLLWQRISY